MKKAYLVYRGWGNPSVFRPMYIVLDRKEAEAARAKGEAKYEAKLRQMEGMVGAGSLGARSWAKYTKMRDEAEELRGEWRVMALPLRSVKPLLRSKP